MNHEVDTNSGGLLPWITALLFLVGILFAGFMGQVAQGSGLLP